MSETTSIQPVLLGADLNCYNVARAFHEAYGVVSDAFGRYAVGASDHSKLIRFHVIPDMDSPEVLVRVLNRYADAHPNKTLIAFGCTDDYAYLLMQQRSVLSDRYLIPYPDVELADLLADKADFYTMCDRYGILYPKTVVLSAPAAAEALAPERLGFSYPVIVKPSSSVAYWKHPFDGMKKVYTADSPEQAAAIIAQIYASGYDRRMIVQDRIPGDDSKMNVLTCYSGEDRRVRMICFGHVLLEEHTPKGLGNHTAILTEYRPELTEKFRKLLDDLGYHGFSNFDIKYDERDGTFRAFEINLRQGRSNYYVTAAGYNIADLAVSDLAEHRSAGISECREEHFWYAIPKGVVRKYVKDGILLDRAKQAQLSRRSASSLWYRPDLCMNPRRLFWVIMHLFNQYKKYKTYYPM